MLKRKRILKKFEGIEFQMKLITELSWDYSETILDNLANKKMVISSAKKDLDAYYSGNTQYYEDEQKFVVRAVRTIK